MMDKLFSPEGRIRRSTFWLRVLVAIAIKLVLLIMAAKPSFELLDIVVSVFLSAFLVVGGIKRMHDVNKSGWYFLIPVFGFILALRRGTEGPNTFGADPKDGITNPNKTALGISVMLLVVAVLALNVPLKSSVRPTRSDRVPNTQKSDSLEALWNVDVVNFFEKSLRLKTQVLFPHLQRTMKYGYIDSLGNWVIEPQFEKAEEFTGQTALIKLNGKFGFVNFAGDYILFNDFTHVGSFHSGMASISMGKKTSWIDSTGRFFHRWYESRTFFSEGLAAVRLNGKWGFVDKTGKLVIPLRYDFVGNFSEGLATVTVNDKRGFIDKNGDLVIPLNYEFADSFNGGYASVTVLVNQTRKRTFIDKNGNPILEPGDYTIFNGRWKPGVVLLKNKVDGKFYFYNVRTKRFKPSRYEYIEDLSDGLRLVKVNGKYGYVDESERFVVPPKYQVAKSFNNGFARIQILNGVPLYLNRRGKIIKNFK